jgi:ABC-type nitrate/sulfonate/bicarbonate transport system substrate-binding protein
MRLHHVAAIGLLLAACGGTAAPGTSGAASARGASVAAAAAASGAASASQAANSGPAAKASTPPAASGQLTPVSIQISAIGFAFFPLFVAKDLNVFQKHGVDAKFVTMPPPVAIPAIQKGDLQFMSTIGSAGRAIERGIDFKVVDVMLSRPAIVIVGAPGVATLNDLKGKVLSASTPDDTLTQLSIALLDKRGLPPSSYTVLHTGTDQAAKLAAMENHAAQAAVLDLVNWLTLEPKLAPAGYTALLTSLQDVEMPYSGLATSAALLKAQPDTVRRTVAAVVEATQLSGSDKAASTGVMVKEMGLSAEAASKLFDDAKQVNLWQADGHASAKGMAYVFQLDQDALKLDKPPTESQIFDWSFLPGASK